MTDIDTTRLRALAAAAQVDHPGPWTTDEHPSCDKVTDADDEWLAFDISSDATRVYIAAANPQAILALLDRMERVERLKEALALWLKTNEDGDCWNAPFGKCGTLGYPPTATDWCAPCLTRSLLMETK